MRARERREALARDGERGGIALRREQHMQHDPLRQHALPPGYVDEFADGLARDGTLFFFCQLFHIGSAARSLDGAVSLLKDAIALRQPPANGGLPTPTRGKAAVGSATAAHAIAMPSRLPCGTATPRTQRQRGAMRAWARS
ncbi:hypothetical protein Busp01_36830 [Trinickia caryophylli]|nr:hypothetical protein Busp01_36830 [Trinickia caryophylli]